MVGYLNRPEATAQVKKDGWYSTGDLGYVDSDGFLKITDRLSRFSKIAGEMVPHMGVESAIMEITGVDEQHVAVTGVPDPSTANASACFTPTWQCRRSTSTRSSCGSTPQGLDPFAARFSARPRDSDHAHGQG